MHDMAEATGNVNSSCHLQAPSAAAYTAAMRGAQDIHPVTSYNAEADPFKLLYQ